MSPDPGSLFAEGKSYTIAKDLRVAVPEAYADEVTHLGEQVTFRSFAYDVKGGWYVYVFDRPRGGTPFTYRVADQVPEYIAMLKSAFVPRE
jgi:hypothetical protein